MMKLIDVDSLMEFARNHKDGKVDCNDIARFPTIDAVPVVRCKDCKHWEPRMDDFGNCTHYRFAIPGACSPATAMNEFCCLGERGGDDGKAD
jgi:hypothetical protein